MVPDSEARVQSRRTHVENSYRIVPLTLANSWDIRGRYQVQLVGRVADLRQRFYAISVERGIKHPAVVAICEGARKDIFAVPRTGTRVSDRAR